MYAVFVRRRPKWAKDTTENKPSVIKPTNYKSSDGSCGNTNTVRKNMEGIVGDSKVNGLKTKRSRGHRE